MPIPSAFGCIPRVLTQGCLGPATHHHNGGDFMLRFEDIDAKLAEVAKQKSNDIEDYLEECRRVEGSVMKILLLGGPSCGKSTIFKQMRIIHKGGFKQPDQLAYYSELINRNIHTIFNQLLAGAVKLQISMDSIRIVKNQIVSRYMAMRELELEGRVKMNQTLAGLLYKFWLSDPVRRVYSKRYFIELLDSTKYFMENINRIGADDWVPNEADIVHSREATETITVTTFEYSGTNLRLVDVGGQKSQRRKWLHLFDDVRVVLYIVDLTSYARKVEDDKDVYSMQNTLKLFSEVATNRILRRSLFLLFLNKIDLFEELLESVKLSECFPKYQGDNSLITTIEHIRNVFLKAALPRKSVFAHCTTATNTENVKVVFHACMESVFKQSTRATGLT